jgi:hypothetical protein
MMASTCIDLAGLSSGTQRTTGRTPMANRGAVACPPVTGTSAFRAPEWSAGREPAAGVFSGNPAVRTFSYKPGCIFHGCLCLELVLVWVGLKVQSGQSATPASCLYPIDYIILLLRRPDSKGRRIPRGPVFAGMSRSGRLTDR